MRKILSFWDEKVHINVKKKVIGIEKQLRNCQNGAKFYKKLPARWWQSEKTCEPCFFTSANTKSGKKVENSS